MISPPGLPVPKKVTARKQESSAGPGSGNFRDALFNIRRAQPPPAQALPDKWVTAPRITGGAGGGESVGGSGGRARAGEGGRPACGKGMSGRCLGGACGRAGVSAGGTGCSWPAAPR